MKPYEPHLDKLHEVSLVPCKLLHVIKDTREAVAHVVDKGDLATIFQKHEGGVGGYIKKKPKSISDNDVLQDLHERSAPMKPTPPVTKMLVPLRFEASNGMIDTRSVSRYVP